MDPVEEGEAEWDALDSGGVDRAEEDGQRVILHFDLDCFYAQVEMIRNPALRTKPLGVQQKYIVVTCNYVARERGVNKLMGVKEALEKCPDLVLVKGEDLVHYREISYRVTELLMSYCPLVERLGFDENFMDVTEMVDKRMKETNISDLSFVGHIYGHEASAVGVREHSRLAVGSVIAAELREALRSRLELTSCAGVANSKLLAKLVSGAFKPNQQTTLLPQSRGTLMDSLSGPCKVPGIGYRTGARLKALGVLSVRDLQMFPLRELIRVFGEANGKRLQSLACGTDLSPVTPAGPPQSLSDEDSFKKISTVSEVESKVKDLLSSLCERMRKDGRLPQTLRLTLRRATTDTLSRWFSRESRQCPIPKHTAHRIRTGCSEAVPQLVSIAMKLFHRVVDVSGSFHLTLLNVCFSNLQNKTPSRTSISSFFTHSAATAAHTLTRGQETEADVSLCEDSSGFTQPDDTQNSKEFMHTPLSTSSSSSSSLLSQNSLPQPVGAKSSTFPKRPAPKHSGLDARDSGMASIPEEKCSRLPPHVDPDVFQALPEHIQMELMASFQAGASVPEGSMERRPSGPAEQPGEPIQFHINQQETPQHAQLALNQSSWVVHNDDLSAGDAPNDDLGMEGQRSPDSRAAESRPLAQTSLPDVPPNVDPLVFSQLPSDMQTELLAEWKQRKPALKTSSRRAAKPSPKHTAARGRRAAAKGSPDNSLLRYFRPQREENATGPQRYC